MNWRVGASHLILFDFEVRGTVDQTSDVGILIQAGKELAGLGVGSNLRKLERNGTSSELGSGYLFAGISNGASDSVLWFAGRLTISDGDDQDRLLQTTGPSRRNNHWFKDLVPQACTQWCQAGEADT
jgi:hypothetical protein